MNSLVMLNRVQREMSEIQSGDYPEMEWPMMIEERWFRLREIKRYLSLRCERAGIPY